MRTVLKWAGLGVGALFVLAVVAVGVGAVVGGSNIDAVHDLAVEPLAISSDSAALARGAHLAGIYGCRDCHGDDLGGQVMGEGGPFRLVASNLTPAGVGGEYDAATWDRAIRHGVRVDGRAMTVMPSGAYHAMSDAEAADLIAYLGSLEPAGESVGRTEFTLLGKVLAAGPLDPSANVYAAPTTASSPAPGATVEYGEYVVEMMCAYCHGAGVVGKQPPEPGAPYAPDLAASGQWDPAQFHETLTTGVLPDGRALDPEVMPWTATARMTREEREGVRLYLASLADRRGADA